MDVFLVVTPGFPEDENDTTCLPPIQMFLLSLRELYPQFQFMVLSFQYPFEEKRYNWHGIPVIALGGKNRPKFFRFLTWMKAYRTLKQLHKEHRIRGIISLWITECALVSSFFSKRHHLRHYMWMQGQDAKQENQYIKRIRPKGEHVIAISDFTQKEFFKNHHQMPFMVAENGIRPSAFPPLNVQTRAIDILGVGSLIPLKNYPLFLDIIHEVVKKYPNLKVKIAGQGPEEQSIKMLLKEKNLNNSVTLLGSVPHADVLQLMADSKIFLHTSDYEGNSTVLMEALYSGCVAFSTRPLSDRPLKHLHVLQKKHDFVRGIHHALASRKKSERVLFNTMNDSARKIMNLFP